VATRHSPLSGGSPTSARELFFVSGEGAAAFWLTALVFIVPKRWKAATAAATLVFASLISFTRIAMGGHFLSDVLIAWLLMLLVMILLGRLILQLPPPGFDAGVERRLAQAGYKLRQAFGLRESGPPL
jgi:membrane-associated phospholipid phosphatase